MNNVNFLKKKLKLLNSEEVPIKAIISDLLEFVVPPWEVEFITSYYITCLKKEYNKEIENNLPKTKYIQGKLEL